MIIYNESYFGFPLLSRFRGSPVVKALTPTILSTGVMIGVHYLYGAPDIDTWESVDHPYAVGVLMSAFTFLLTFRANFAYNRYWEAVGAVHMMHSKWIDAGVNVAAFHLQSDQYKESMPRSFGKNPNLTLTRRRFRGGNTRKNSDVNSDLKSTREWLESQNKSLFHKIFFKKRKNRKTKNKRESYVGTPTRRKLDEHSDSFMKRIPSIETNPSDDSFVFEDDHLPYESRLDGGIKNEKSSLFFQEMTHLLSLLSAVALSTLRHDIEFAETPLGTYVTNQPWPPVDPDHPDAKVIRNQYIDNSIFATVMMYLFGYTRSSYHRTLYNATRPFKVIGGVSDAEATLLLEARGPFAKVTLVLLWIQEFYQRESMNGSTGAVAPPIISRFHQATTDGFDNYNTARKIAYTPFPFPHAQITSYFVVVTCCIMPVFMLSYSANIVLAGILNFLSLLCFTGLHEVARELESPFRNAPNDIPLNNYQAQFNEALICLCAGYHPDSMWEVPDTPHGANKKSIVTSFKESSFENARAVFSQSIEVPLAVQTEIEVNT